jgi:hypothetical protein
MKQHEQLSFFFDRYHGVRSESRTSFWPSFVYVQLTYQVSALSRSEDCRRTDGSSAISRLPGGWGQGARSRSECPALPLPLEDDKALASLYPRRRPSRSAYLSDLALSAKWWPKNMSAIALSQILSTPCTKSTHYYTPHSTMHELSSGQQQCSTLIHLEGLWCELDACSPEVETVTFLARIKTGLSRRKLKGEWAAPWWISLVRVKQLETGSQQIQDVSHYTVLCVVCVLERPSPAR